MAARWKSFAASIPLKECEQEIEEVTAGAIAERIFRTAFFVLRSGQPYRDPARPVPPPPETLPHHLVPQAEAARTLGMSRQAVGNRIKAGTRRAEEWNGKTYVVRKYLEILIQQKQGEQKQGEQKQGEKAGGRSPTQAG